MPSNFYAVAKINREFVIPFVGLKIGSHTFEFDITDAFFENVEYALIKKGKVHVTFTLEKKETMMIGDFDIAGEVETVCDRCDDSLNLKVKGTYQLIYAFDNEPSDNETLIVVYPEEFELDLRENLLELITVSLPARSLHPKGECNEEMMNVLNQYRVNSDDDEDDFDIDDEDEDDEDYEDDEDDFEDEIEEEDPSEEAEQDGEDEGGEVDPRWAALKNWKK